MGHLINKFDNFSVNENYDEIEEISLDEDDNMLDAEVAAEMEAEEMVEDDTDEMTSDLMEEEEEEECVYDEGDEEYECLVKFDKFLAVNEEGAIKKFFTGVSDDKEKEELKSKLMAELDKYEKHSGIFVPRKSLEKQAEDNDWIGSFRLSAPAKTGKYKGKRYVQYVLGKSGLRKVFAPDAAKSGIASSGARQG